MPKYMVERDIAGIGRVSTSALRALSQKSCSVLHGIGPYIKWQQSFVAGDKLYCVFIAPSEAVIREHARQTSLSISAIEEIRTTIDPATSE